MPGAVLKGFTYIWPLQQRCKVVSIVIPILQMTKVRLRAVK